MSELVFQRRFTAKTEQLKPLREWVREIAAGCGISAQRTEQLIIGVNEACMNIIEHGYAKLPGDIIFEALKDNGYLVLRLTDFATTVDCACIKSRSLDDIRPGGLGVHFIHEVMDKVVYRPGEGGQGNVIEMSTLLPQEQ